MQLVLLRPVAVLVALATAADLSAADVDYASQIKPLLAKYCTDCHGADTQESGLRVDLAGRLIQGGNRGPAVLPGKADSSRLILVLEGREKDLRMPPEGDGPTADEIALLRAWINQGAKHPAEEGVVEARRQSDHWAFQPIAAPPLPAVKRGDWCRNPIEHFILAELERRGIEPSPPADPATLLRRVSLDLTGLPPTPEDVAAFLADPSPAAYERWVDRLLDSPHYGERWGRHWLDLARYADSNGFTIDSPRQIWRYRDWVIDAINRDLPFDQFVVHQIAGDLLPGAGQAELIATGFHRNTLVNEEGGTDREQFRVEAVADRVATTGSVFLGLTLGCARCNDHKYDPVSQRDFYQLFAFYNSVDEPTLPVPTPQQQQQLEQLAAQIAAAESRLREIDTTLQSGQEAWEAALRSSLAEVAWTTLPAQRLQAESVTLQRQDDGSVFADANPPRTDRFRIESVAPLRRITALRLETLTDQRLPKTGPGLASNGNFVLHEVQFAVADADNAAAGTDPAKLPQVKFARATADHSQPGYPVAAAIDGKLDTGWAINGAKDGLNNNRTAVFVLAEPLTLEPGQRLVVQLVQQQDTYLIGRFRLSVTDVPAEALELPDAVRAGLAVEPAKRSKAQQTAIATYYLQQNPQRAEAAAALAALEKQRGDLNRTVPTTLIFRERSQPRPTHVHIRGDFLRPGRPVAPDVPAVLPPLPEGVQNPNRLHLAKWLVDAANPLTPRVTVNRFWQRFFGRGLVETENDFGLRGAPPTHPELLDWLAGEFVRRGWRMKQMHRLIVTSATYRQSSHVRSDLHEIDPENKLLARQNRLRLEAECVRDVALAASGLLHREIGGPSVYPPQPEGLDRFTQNRKNWKPSPGGDRYRRGMYTFFWRSNPHPFLVTFDAPDSNATCTRRVRSNTPLQALMLANDLAFVEAARALGRRLLREVPDDDHQRLRQAVLWCLSRQPDAPEMSTLVQFLQTQRAEFAADPQGAAQFCGLQPDEKLDAAETAAWTAVARVLLNLDEFITRE